MTATSAPAANGCDATCRCRSVTPIADPCSCKLYPRGTCCYCETVAGGVTAKQPREQSKAEMLAEWDRRMQAALAANPAVNPARQLPEGAECRAPASASPAVATDGSGSTAPRPKGRHPKKATRRSAVQMQRAAEQERREAALRVERATRGSFLEGALEEEDRWAASLRDAGND